MSSPTVSDRLRPASDRFPEALSFRILSVDGGGIRGVIPALLLKRLEAMLAEALAAAPSETAASWQRLDSPRIADCFHLIAGTSTGGLLAAALTNTGPSGRPRLTAAEAASVYSTHGPAIFHSSFVEKVEQGFGWSAPKYPLASVRPSETYTCTSGRSLILRSRGSSDSGTGCVTHQRIVAPTSSSSESWQPGSGPT